MTDGTQPRFLLHADFAAQAGRTPGAIALHFADSAITCADLAQRSARVATALARRGIGSGSFVGLHVDRSIDYVVAMLGVLAANAAVVPLPPAHPRARLVDLLEFARLDAVIDHADTPLAPVPGTPILGLADLASETGDPIDFAPGQPDQPAFVLASSGSTGKPKLIVRSHRSFYHRLCWTWSRHPYGPDERCVQKSTMTTTHAIYELFEPLLRGVPTLIIGDHETRDLEGFWRTINTWSITRLLVVPSALQVSMEFPGFAAPSLRVVVLMGEYVHRRLAERAIEVFPEATALYSAYGSTEASSTLLCDLRESWRPDRELPLGRPIAPEVQAHVLGSGLEPVAAGETGLLYLGGTPLFTEYFRDRPLTDSAFVVSSVAGGHLYDTHDQVRVAADGALEYVGRTDHTVKVRGFRVDIEEVERTLLLHPAVNHAAIVLNQDDSGDASLIGFYAPGKIPPAGVRSFLRERLPLHMVPSALVGLDALPRTASGKTDRRRLLEEFVARTASPTGTEALSPTELRVGKIWQTVLKHGHAGADSSFFEVGGTSLTSFAAMHRVREAFALHRDRLPDDVIYKHQTLRELSSHIDRVLSGAAGAESAGSGILVTLRRGSDGAMPPLFLIASAGGTLGAYERLARAIETKRDVIGVRDPYVWGDRDATRGFRAWIDLYLDAIRQRQPHGPYHLVAYSSAGAFGYEIARRLRAIGQEVALLAIVDPFGIDRPSKGSYGQHVAQARFRRPHYRLAVRVVGRLRAAMLRFRRPEATSFDGVDLPLSAAELARRVHNARRSPNDVAAFSSLLALNTGVPFAIGGADLAGLLPEHYFPEFLERARKVAPEFDTGTVTRIFEQYFGLQVPSQQRYPLRRYDGRLLLVELDDGGRGVIAEQFRPHVRELAVRRLTVDESSVQADLSVLHGLSPGLRKHFLCMRDDGFVRQLAATLEDEMAGRA